MSLNEILSFFGWRKPKGSDILIDELLDDIEVLLAKNKIGFLQIEREISRVKVFESNRADQVKDGVDNEYHKRIILREIMSLRKRQKTLSRIGQIYQQNIDIHLAVQERLQDHQAAGMKSITHAHLENIALDHEEALAEHREVMATAKAMIDHQSYLDEVREDPELQALAAELNAEFIQSRAAPHVEKELVLE